MQSSYAALKWVRTLDGSICFATNCCTGTLPCESFLSWRSLVSTDHIQRVCTVIIINFITPITLITKNVVCGCWGWKALTTLLFAIATVYLSYRTIIMIVCAAVIEVMASDNYVLWQGERRFKTFRLYTRQARQIRIARLNEKTFARTFYTSKFRWRSANSDWIPYTLIAHIPDVPSVRIVLILCKSINAKTCGK